MRRAALAVVFLAVAALPAYGQVKLEWKFKEGDKFFLENTTELKQQIEVMGQKIPQDSTNITVSSFKVLSKSAEGVVLEQKIESVKVKGNPAGAQMADQMVGTTFKITMNAKGEVTKFEGFDEFIKKIAKDNEEVAKLLKAILTEDTMKQGVGEAFLFTPDKPVSKGDKWNRKMTMSMGPIGSFLVTQEYTYVGPAKEGEQVDVKALFAYNPPKGDAGGLPFKVTKGEFKTEEAKGTLFFDAAAGRLIKHEFRAKLKGTMTIQAGGNEAAMEMTQDTHTVIRMSNEMPK